MDYLFGQTPGEIDIEIAKRLAKVRKRRRITQQELAGRSGVSLGSLKRFERTGEISLLSLTKLAVALEMEAELCHLFEVVAPLSIEEVIHGAD